MGLRGRIDILDYIDALGDTNFMRHRPGMVCFLSKTGTDQEAKSQPVFQDVLGNTTTRCPFLRALYKLLLKYQSYTMRTYSTETILVAGITWIINAKVPKETLMCTPWAGPSKRSLNKQHADKSRGRWEKGCVCRGEEADIGMCVVGLTFFLVLFCFGFFCLFF